MAGQSLHIHRGKCVEFHRRILFRLAIEKPSVRARRPKSEVVMLCIYCGSEIIKRSYADKSIPVCLSKDCYNKHKYNLTKKWRKTEHGRICTLNSNRKWIEKNREKHNKNCREYGRKTNWEASKKWKERNKELVKERARKKYLEAVAKDPEYSKKRRLKNLEKSREASRLWKIRHRQGPISKAELLNERVRSHIRTTIKNFKIQKKSRTFEMLGYEPIDLVRHLESLFIFGMTWKNYGEWHIDHIKPVSWHDIKSEGDIKKCWSLKNLKPRWSTTKIAEKYGSFEEGNLNKGNRYIG